VLSFGLGFGFGSAQPGVEAVEFVVLGNGREGPREIFRTAIPLGSPRAAQWEDHTVPLDRVSGPATTFRFVTRLRLAPDADPTRAAAIPLWGAPEVLTPSADDEHPNIVLVSLDTLRADHVGALGSTLPLTPRIDALAAEGVVFENATTTFPSTTGAHLSMMTGLYPIRLGIADPSQSLHVSVRTLAELLAAAGWRTAAVTEAAMLAARVGFDRGFSHYRENLEKEPVDPPSYKAAHTTDAAIAWLEQNRADRFFLFLHTYAVHFPYAAPQEYQFTTWKDGAIERPLSAAPLEVALRYRYAADVRYADVQVGRLVDALRRLDLTRRTIVVVTSDHGDAYGEHGTRGHGQTMYEEIMHIPLILWGPGQLPAGRRVRTPFSLVDLLPTILELAGVPPRSDVDGESQLARLRGGPEDPERVVFGAVAGVVRGHRRQIVARTSTTKWIFKDGEPPTLVVYDLLADPRELRPLDDPALLERGRGLMARYQALGGKATTPIAVPIDEDTREQLRALGYLD
jgi:arylsulfatase A-like enzyme